MKKELYNYDIYPKVFIGDNQKQITVKPLGDHVKFKEGINYKIKVFKVNRSNPQHYPETGGRSEIMSTVSGDGTLSFYAYFEGEGEHFVNIYLDEEQNRFVTLSVYSLLPDMAGRIPLRGDLHMHTCRSDGSESPEIVSANYRAAGYDFFAITDHHRYYPSLEAIEAFKDITDFNIVPGEEVHLPLNDAHYVNFGGSYSINALVTPNYNQEKCGDAPEYRGICENPPEPMTRDEFIEMIKERSKNVPRENESERLSYAVIEWIYEHIQNNGGLGIFPHPYWLCPMMQLPEDYTEFIYKNAPFDAFEVLGGELYYQHNGFQANFYYDMKSKGIDRAIVGSTDSHGSTEHNVHKTICSTVVFAKSNTDKDIISAIKDKYSVAVDTISKEYRLVGDFRLVKYASFLMENYFPVHDLACAAEGYYMKQYINGDKRALAVLSSMKGEIPEMQNKYFDL